MDALGCGGATDWSELGTVPVMSELTEILKVVLNNKIETQKVSCCLGLARYSSEVL